MKANQHLTGITTALLLALSLVAGALTPAAAQTAAPDAEVTFSQALADAHKVTELNTGWTVYVSHGESMLPQIDHNSLLLVARTDFSKLSAGMLVVYRDASGDMVSHRLIAHTDSGWVAKGLNNNKEDPGMVTRDNLQGVVFGTMKYQAGTDSLASIAATSQPTIAYAKKY